MCARFAPRQTSAEVKRRVKADSLTPACPTGFRPSIYVISTAGSGTSGRRLRLRQAKLCSHPAHATHQGLLLVEPRA